MKKELNLFMVPLTESFIAMLPFLLLHSIMLMIVQSLRYFNIENFVFTYETYILIATSVNKMFIPLLVISIAFHFARRFNINSFMTIFNAIIVIVTSEIFLNTQNNDLFPSSISIYVLIVPIISAYFFRIYGKYFIYENQYLQIATQVNISFKYIIPSFFNYLFSLIIILILESSLFLYSFEVKTFLSELPLLGFLFLKLFWTDILWFFGIHGGQVSIILFDSNIFQSLYIENLTNVNIHNIFIVYGGSGAVMSLAIAILVYKKNKQWNKTVKLASPFLLFNISEIMIFGLPIILNRYLLIPFIVVPLVNFVIIYSFLSLNIIEFIDINIHWTTPIFINAYLLTDGSITAILLQILMLIIGVVLYYPFVKRYSENQSKVFQEERLMSNLHLSYALNAQEGININNDQALLIKNNNYINDVISLIAKNKLEVYYQPKINIKNNTCEEYEALIRFHIDGKTKGPYFIEEFEDVGLSPIIDFWVCTQVKKDLDYLKIKYNYQAKISINISMQTLSDFSKVNKIDNLLKNYEIEFEINERAELKDKRILENILLLRKNGYSFSIDDFGVGYSNIDVLYNTHANTIKFDKSLIDNLGKNNADVIFNSLCNLCDKLNYKVLIEGVETQEQADIIKNSEATYIQGHYFSKALTIDDIFIFQKEFNRSK